MINLNGPEDTYRQLVEQSDKSWLLGLLAFATIEEQRIEWMRHYETKNGALPSDQLVHDWYLQQPSGVLLRASGAAESALQLYAQEVASTLEEDYRQEIQQSTLIREIRSHNRFWPQFGANVAAGLVSTLIFSVVLVILAAVVLKDPSPVALIRQLQESPNGK
ncbi:hypothetical protein [Xanthomonas sp. BRIP62415]|uniref:hypothetical protein n=1 Tax=Xanthomonas sp. BRIP62415 TaxID=2182390 RepID=UPI000F8E9247|nr:hypothetical protein [Xanthomonas sp. BRIP62415]